MKEFEVTITETLQKSITVEAATREEAQAMVEEMWDKGDVVLDADHFSSIPKELQKKYEEKFKKPEAFLKMGRSIMAIPTEPTASNPKPDRKAPGMEL